MASEYRKKRNKGNKNSAAPQNYEPMDEDD